MKRSTAQPRKGKVVKELEEKHEVNKPRAAQLIKRTERVKKDKGQLETLKKAIRHKRVAHRIHRANGICARAAAHSLKARQLARDVLKANKKTVTSDDQNTAEKDAMLATENAAELNAEAAKEQVQDTEIEKAVEEGG